MKPATLRHTKPRKRWKKYKRPGGGQLLILTELAVALGETERTVRRWKSMGLIPVLTLGHRSLRFRLGAVLLALEKRQIKSK
jgi:hypothetical protein